MATELMALSKVNWNEAQLDGRFPIPGSELTVNVHPALPAPQSEEFAALRIIACSFYAPAAYITVESIRHLTGGQSRTGLALAAASLVIMPILSITQRRAGRQLGSVTSVGDCRQTLLCTYLSAILLAGLALNIWFGWSWADPAAGLVIAAIAVKEGRDAWRGDTCCPTLPATGDADECADGCCDTNQGR